MLYFYFEIDCMEARRYNTVVLENPRLHNDGMFGNHKIDANITLRLLLQKFLLI